MKKWRFVVLVLLPLIISCTIGKIESEEPDKGGSGEKVSMSFMMPVLDTDVLVNSEHADGQSTRFTSTWNNDGKVFMFAKQNGKFINLGRYSITATNTENSTFKVEIDASDKLDTRATYQLYGLSGLFNVDNNELFYRVNLARNGGFSLWFDGKSGNSKMSKVAGTAEILLVINKSDKPIQFVHTGYDAEEKWYYTKAEVSVEDGHIQNAEQGAEVVGTAKEIKVYDGKTLPRVISYYVPNGKKIQDAQLIAEINGKEVRSENRISSDITLLTNHSYGIFAVWDGEKLTLGDGGDKPVIHVTSDAGDADFTVVDVGSDETMTIKTTRGNMPKVGDVLASGPTEKAPYGFLCRVVAVDEVSSRSVIGDAADEVVLSIKKGEAYIDDVLPDKDFDFPIPLEDLKIDHANDAEGNEVTVLKDDDYLWKVVDIPIPLKLWTNKEKDEDTSTHYAELKGEFKISWLMDPKKLTFFVHLGHENIAKWGVAYDYRSKLAFDANLTLKGNILNLSDKTLIDETLTPITIPTEVPIVITPKWVVKCTAILGAKLKANVRLFENTADVATELYYTALNPKVPKFTFKPNNEENRFFMLNSTDASVEFDGDVELSFTSSLTFGLYGSNLTPDGLNSGFRIRDKVELKSNVHIGYEYINKNSFTDYSTCEVTDEASMAVGHISEGDVYLTFFNPFRWKTSELALHVWNDDDEHWDGKMPLLYASFRDIEANLHQTDYVTFTATKVIPLVPLNEDDFGFCYRIDDENSSSEWKLISLKDYYNDPWHNNNLLMTTSYPIECNFSTKNLLPNTRYVFRPYVVSYNGLEKVFIPRGKSIKIQTDSKGKVNNTTIEDIPGEKLAPKRHRR